MRNQIVLSLLIAFTAGICPVYANNDSGHHDLISNNLQNEEKQNDNIIIEKQGWDRRADKYVRTARLAYDRAVQQYEKDQKNHASANKLQADQRRIQKAKSRLDVALADQRKSQRALDHAQATDRTIEHQLSTLNTAQKDSLNREEKQTDQRLLEKQGWDRRADKYVRTTRITYDQVLQRYQQDMQRHASAHKLDQDRKSLQKAKQRLDIALADQQRSQRALEQAQSRNSQLENRINHQQ